MNNLTCKYHSGRDASAKCERCGAMVCIECKNVLRQTHSSSSHSSDHRSSHTYTTRHDLCPECYAKKISQQYNPICCFINIGIISGFVIFIYRMMFQSLFPDIDISDIGSLFDNLLGGDMMTIALTGFLGMLILVMFCMGYNYFIKGPKMKKEANRRRDVALNSLQGSNYGY